MAARILPTFLKGRIRALPDRPGVYLFRDRAGDPLYIGKAVSIKKRVAGHFRYFGESFSKEGKMLDEVRRVDCVETVTEAEALLLEASLVKQHLPKYNQELKDDKSYPFLKITAEEYPRLLIVRGRKADGGKYFGPYTSAKLLRQAVRLLRRLFPIRTCKTLPKKVCLMYHIGQCRGPCEGFQSRAEYLETVKDLEQFLEGRREALLRMLSRQMKEYSAKREYEKAQLVYEEIRALSTIAPPGGRRKEDPQAVLEELQKSLDLPRLPATIEAFDISNIFGSEAVGSLVVFTNGVPARAEYRKFRIKTVKGIDDYRMMQEVVRRRYSRVIAESQPLALSKVEGLPDLVVIDGGKGHLAAAKAVLDELGLSDLPVIAIAKQHEHLFKPSLAAPFIFPQSSSILQLIQRLRDEAHRFAIGYHRQLHKKEALASLLDEIPGVGPQTRRRLLTKVGALSKIRTQTEEALAVRAGISRKTAKNILEFLNMCYDAHVR